MQTAEETQARTDLDWTAIRTAGHHVRRVVIEELQRVVSQTGTFDLEEVFLRQHEGGDIIMAAMDNPASIGAEPRFKFRALALDHTGEPAKPGDTIRFRIGRKLNYFDGQGNIHAMNSHHFDSMQTLARVRNDDKLGPYLWESHQLDNDCCFQVGYSLAWTIIAYYSRHSGLPQVTEYRKIDHTTGMPFGEPYATTTNWLAEYVRPGSENVRPIKARK